MRHSYKWALLAGLVLAACSAEETTTTDPTPTGREGADAITMTVEGYDVDNETRTALTSVGNTLKFSWSSGDKIGVFGESKTQQLALSMVSGEDTKSASFTSDDYQLVKGKKYIAYYPLSDKVSTTGDDITVDYTGQTQTGNASTDHLGACDYIVSDATEATETNTAAFTLQHIGTVLRLQLTMPEAGSWQSVTLSTADGSEAFTTGGTLDLSAKAIKTEGATTSSSVTLNLDDVTTTDEDNVLTVWIMLAPVDINGKMINVTVTSALAKANDAVGSFTPSKKYVAGKAYSISINATAQNSKFPAGPFKVAFYPEEKYVTFANGNLLYDIQNKKYKLATTQWEYYNTSYLTPGPQEDRYDDYYTIVNDHITKTLNEEHPYIIEFYGWGTAKDPTYAPQDYTSSTNNKYLGSTCTWSDYKVSDSGNFDASDDWGTVAARDVPELNGSRTLTYNEWYILVYNHLGTRVTLDVDANNSYAGIVIFPWGTTSTEALTYLTGDNIQIDYAYYYKNNTQGIHMSIEQLKLSGALFLPFSGYRFWTDKAYDAKYIGMYWSATAEDSDKACYLQIEGSEGRAYKDGYRSSGKSVRLAKDVTVTE